MVLAVDVGGTNTKAGLVSKSGGILAQETWATQAGDGPQAFVQGLRAHADSMITSLSGNWADVSSIGIGLPGFLDRARGQVIEAVNLHWNDVPIVQMVREALAKDVVIDNDGNLAALGEVWLGAGQGAKYAVCATIGTGIGGGVVLNGQVYRGASSMAAEIGHMQLMPDGPQCNCGHRGCFETLASATAIAREGLAVGLAPAAGCGNALSARDVFEYAAAGDARAALVVDNAVHWLATGLALVANVMNPDVIVVGGGVTAAGAFLFEPLERAFRALALPRTQAVCKLRPAALGNDAGFIGAARLAWQHDEGWT